MDNLKNGDQSGKRTTVEEGTQFKGSLSSSCPIVVKGRIDGDISAPSLSVSQTGSVHGKVKVGQIESQGELSGEFDADVIQLSGTIRDKTVVRAKALEVKLAPVSGKMQVVFGECVLDVGDLPSKEATSSSPRESERPFGENGRNGSGEKEVLPGLNADAIGDDRRSKSAPPKRA